MKQKLMVVCGGQSSEHIVSRMSCTSVMNNLNKENYDVTLVGIDQDGSWYILDQNQEDLAKDIWLDNAKALQDVFGLLKQQDVVLPIYMELLVKMEQSKVYLNLLEFLMWDVVF